MGSANSGISGVLSGLSSWFSRISQTLKEIYLFLTNFFDNFFEFLKKILVPEDDYFTKKFTYFHEKISKKMGFDLSSFEKLKMSVEGPDPIFFEWNGEKYIFTDFKVLKDNIDYIRKSLSFLLYFFLFLFGINSFLKLIRGHGFLNS